jgi:5-methylcytosine-specific restriction endonuclease McrA
MSTISLDRISISAMPDRDLLKRLVRVADNERHLTADVLALLGECDVRRLYLGEGCSSLFTYCTQVLHFSEHAAYHRIEAARAARQFPNILDMVAHGSVTLTTVALLRPHLTPGNHRDLLTAARHRTKREVEYQIACLAPKPDAKAFIRRIPASARALTPTPTPTSSPAPEPAPAPAQTPAPTAALAPTQTPAPGPTPTLASRPLAASPLGGGAVADGLLVDDAAPSATSTSAPLDGQTAAHGLIVEGVAPNTGSARIPPEATEPRTQVAPLAADRYLLRVTLSAETYTKLRRAQQLMGHRVSGGDPHAIIGRALSLLVEHLERAKFAKVRRPRAGSDATTTPSSTSASPSTSASSRTSKLPSTSASASASGSRRIPAMMRRHVWARDEGRCAFVGSHGRCTETSRLEFHHVVPFARGGPTVVENLALRCRAHNVYESDQAFGCRVQRGSGQTTQAGLQEKSLLDEAPH